MSHPAFRTALLGLALFGCTSSSSASAAAPPPADAPERRPPHQISPVRPPMLASLRVELRPHAPGATCDELLVNGQRSDLKSLADAARVDLTRDPNLEATLIPDPACSPAMVQQVTDALHQAGVKNISSPAQAPQGASADAPPSESEKAAARGVNAFAAALYAQLIKTEKGNLFFSPASVAGALALLDVGAAGKTASELDQVLGTGLPHEQSHQAVAALLQRYLTGRGDATLEVASRLWGAERFVYKPSYLSAVKQEFGAAAERVNFVKGDEARGTINGWVSEQTHGKITELIGRNALGPDTSFVLTNAVYFYGAWRVPFDLKATAAGPFTLASGMQVQANLMHANVKARGLESAQAQVVELPYGKSGTLAFDLIVPREKNGLPQLEAGLTGASLDQLLSGLRSARVNLAMPKFTERSQLPLMKPLSAMGLASLAGAPDLSAMTDSRGAAISAVLHQAFVDVNEKGTEAAAATAVIGTRALHRDLEMTVSADHPFLFLIRDTATGGILFMGRVADPRS